MAHHLKISISARLGHFHLHLDVDMNSLVTGVFGPSGAGKTSLFKCLAGLHRHATGVISFNQTIWQDSQHHIFLPPEARGIGYVPQEGLLFPNKNVQQNLLIGSQRRKHRAATDVSSSNVSLQLVCELLELSTLLTRQVDTLSGGERQRVALGRAILSNPDLLLLDEPLASLGINLRRKILPFLRRIREELNIPMILISHNPTEIQALCDQVLVIELGKEKVFGQPNKIMLTPHVLTNEQGESYENILPARLHDNQPLTQTDTLELGQYAGGPLLITNRISKSSHPTALKTLLVGIPARDIILAKFRPEAISAQNILPANVKTIQCIGNTRMVTTALHASRPELTVEISVELSAQGWESLNLRAGDKVFLVIKTSSCILYQ